MVNRLSREKSPYLKLHADNPVDWYPWSEEAFEKAKKEDKPIFLSIGYYTCHWCHVMNRESFSDPEVARELNKVFIPIKVDREERPDVDSLYMKYSFAVTGGGGWPLTVLLTPDKKPFFIATYLPKDTLIQLIKRVDELWRNDREKIYRYAEDLVRGVVTSPMFMVGDSYRELGLDVVDTLVQRLSASYDPIHGGFGHPPKFPNPHRHLFLLRYSWLYEEMFPVTMVHTTGVRMRFGGLYDHVWGGFHRYSTDAIWKLPHFEKMLYDQAWLIRMYTEAYQVTGDWIFRDTVEGVYRFLEEWMYDGSALYSAVDAESEGVEGRFYIWSMDEFRDALGDLYDPAYRIFGLEEDGNYREEATGRKNGYNVLFPSKRWEEHAVTLGMNFEEFMDYISNVLKHLREYASDRVKPNIDYKILADWNSMTAASLAYAYRVFQDDRYLSMAIGGVEFILHKMYPDTLLHTYVEGEASVNGFLDDYASLLYALNELYMATGRERYLDRARDVAEDMINLFRHPDLKIFLHTPITQEDLPHPDIELFDGPYPSGQSIAIHELLRLSRMTNEDRYWEIAIETLKTVLPNVERSVEAAPYLAVSTLLGVTGGGEIIYSDDVFRDIDRVYAPFHVIVKKDIDGLVRLETPMTSKESYIYVCQGYVCHEPSKTLRDAIRQVYRLRKTVE